MGDAVAILELTGVATGYLALDRMLKHSPVTIIEANLVEPGKFLILYTGGVAEVQEAHNAILESYSADVLEEIILPFAHHSVIEGLKGNELRLSSLEYDCIGVIETNCIAATLLAVDRSVKDCNVNIVGIRVAIALGGRAFFVVHGAQHDVEEALEVSEKSAADKGGVRRKELIPRPHNDMIEWLLRPAPFSVGE
jgi:microcompartment protein CcmL/EutN